MVLHQSFGNSSHSSSSASDVEAKCGNGVRVSGMLKNQSGVLG